MLTIAVFNQKGGAGKTMLSMLLAAEWHARGKQVLLIDSDPQRSAHKWETKAVEGYPPFPVKVEWMVGLSPNQYLAALAKRVRDETDLILIDTPPRLDSTELYAALYVADIAILPFVPDALHSDALEEVESLLQKIQAQRIHEGRPKLDVYIVVNKHDKRRTLQKMIIDNVDTITDIPRLPVSISYRSAFEAASTCRTTLSSIARKNDPARQEIAALADAIIKVSK